MAEDTRGTIHSLRAKGKALITDCIMQRTCACLIFQNFCKLSCKILYIFSVEASHKNLQDWRTSLNNGVSFAKGCQL